MTPFKAPLAAPRRASIRRRLLAAFVFLALSMGAALGLAGRFSFDFLGASLLAWHTRPVMDALIEAERRAWEAEDRGGEKLYYGEDLAAVMHWRFLAGKEVPDAWRALPDGLHLSDNRRDFVLLERRDQVVYALSGEVGVFAALKQKLTGALLLCALAGLALAVFLAVVLSRRLTAPLRELTAAVEGRPPEALLRDGAAQPPRVPCTELDDEVGVLARAVAARETALRSFVQRESNFTGDVSHELRTPLTVLQGGLEILEPRLAALPQRAELLPVLRRLARTVEGMADTVRTLLLLARRPEELECRELDATALLCGILRRMERDGLLRLEAGTPEAAACGLAGRAAADPVTAAPMASDLDAPGQPVPEAELSGPATSAEDAVSDVQDPSGPPAQEPAAAPAPPRPRPAVGLTADLAPAVRVWGQRDLVNIVFKNLLDNACKYTENDRAAVSLTSVALLVRNSGRIPAGADVFARGTRHGRNRAPSGHGLGLSLALRACERLHWRLDLLPAGPEEAVFRVSFAPPPQGERPA